MSANLILEYILSQRKEKNTLPNNGAVISTIVSSKMTDAICENYGMKLFKTLTGFKNIAKIIRGFEENNNNYECLYSYEESAGCIIGTHARDKDGITALMALCEIAAYYKEKNMTLCDAMTEMYEKYGYYLEDQISLVLQGIEGEMKIKKMMEDLRNNPVLKIADYTVEEIEDIETGKIHNYITGEDKESDIPRSNVLCYKLENGSWWCARPSGTEPKIKFYFGVRETTYDKAKTHLNVLKEGVNDIINIK